MDYTQLFRDFHMNPNCSKYFTRSSEHQVKLIEKMSASEKLKGLGKEDMKNILQVMAHVTYGIIFEYLQGVRKMNYDEIIKYMEETADNFIQGYKAKKGRITSYNVCYTKLLRKFDDNLPC